MSTELIPEKYAMTELMIQAAEGNSVAVSNLLASGADVNERDNRNGTALMYAAMNNRIETLRLLLQAGANQYLKTKKGTSALDFAKKNKLSEVVECLSEFDELHKSDAIKSSSMSAYARIGYFLLLGIVTILIFMLISLTLGALVAENLAQAGVALWIGWILNSKTRRLSLSKPSYLILCAAYLIVVNTLAPINGSSTFRENPGYFLLLMIVIAYTFTWIAIKTNKDKQISVDEYFGKKKVQYQDIVIEALNKAMDIDLKGESVFENCPVNNLEAVIAMYWMVERSFQALPRPKLEKAGSHLMDEVLAWLSDDYSKDEISRLVIPAFDKRLNKYSDLFVTRLGEEHQAPLLRTFKQIVENVFAEDEAHITQIMAAIHMWWQPISEEGARIAALDKKGEVAW